MKLSPQTKFNIIFWTVSAPVIPILTIMVLLVLIVGRIPKMHKFTAMSKGLVEYLVERFAIWRNNLPIVKNAYDRAHLFDYLRDKD